MHGNQTALVGKAQHHHICGDGVAKQTCRQMRCINEVCRITPNDAGDGGLGRATGQGRFRIQREGCSWRDMSIHNRAGPSARRTRKHIQTACNHHVASQQ